MSQLTRKHRENTVYLARDTRNYRNLRRKLQRVEAHRLSLVQQVHELEADQERIWTENEELQHRYQKAEDNRVAASEQVEVLEKRLNEERSTASRRIIYLEETTLCLLKERDENEAALKRYDGVRMRADWLGKCFRRGARIAANMIQRLEGDLAMAELEADAARGEVDGLRSGFELAKREARAAREEVEGLKVGLRLAERVLEEQGVVGGELLDEVDDPEDTVPSTLGDDPGPDACPERAWMLFRRGYVPTLAATTFDSADLIELGTNERLKQYVRADLYDAIGEQSERQAVQIEQLTERVDELVGQLTRRTVMLSVAVGSTKSVAGPTVRGRAYEGPRNTRKRPETSGVSASESMSTKGRTYPLGIANEPKTAVTEVETKSACQNSAVRPCGSDGERVTSGWLGRLVRGLTGGRKGDK